jgi:beta-phosphoglucomutase-like phosphatase (HAD superfamily)
VAVEDTAHGIAAAAAVGMRTIGIPNPYVPIETLTTADLVLGSAVELSLSEALYSVR